MLASGHVSGLVLSGSALRGTVSSSVPAAFGQSEVVMENINRQTRIVCTTNGCIVRQLVLNDYCSRSLDAKSFR